MDVREFDDIVFIFDSDTSALLHKESLIMAGEINGWARTLHADGQCNERNLFDAAHPIVRMIAAGVKTLNERTNTNVDYEVRDDE